jgi:RNA polymerase sigma-70 factor (ECF subfamily)
VPHLSELELLAERDLILAAQRDRAAFAPLYERYVDQIFAYVHHQVQDRELAEDVTAATFAKAIEELPKFQWRGVPYSAWLYRVASNLVAREKRRPRLLDLESPPASPAPGPDEVAQRSARAAEVRAAVATLPDDQRQAILLRFGGEMRNREIAGIMGRSEGAVKLLTFRAVTNLRNRLGAPLPAERHLISGR